jgi:hypothetical protein
LRPEKLISWVDGRWWERCTEVVWSLEAVKEVILPFLCACLLGVLLVARFWLRCWLSHDWLLSIGFGHLEVVYVL